MKEKIYIGVAWPYANGSLHLGHIAGCYLPADIFARYSRMKGKDVLMVSGSDEHGTPITITAEKENTTPQAIVDRYNKEHTENMKQFGISFDLFTRTTTKNHESVVQDIFSTLYEKGHIYKKSIDAFYCENCSRFLPDRYIEGVCPHCGNEKARGDQCDECGMLLNTKELLKVKCKLCGGTPIIRTSDHLFFALSKFESKLLDWIEDKKHWKSSVIKFTRNWLKDGLKDRAITRDLSWGVNVPGSSRLSYVIEQKLPEFYDPTVDLGYDPDDKIISYEGKQKNEETRKAEEDEIKDFSQPEENYNYVQFKEDKWGMIPPIPGFENKRIYVWFDAVIGYLAASKEWSKKQGEPSKWEEWWRNKDARHYYFLAKDNIPFHSIIWPSILMGYDESLNLPYDIPANEYLRLKGEQFSKSRGTAIWVPDILEKFDADAVRYYLSINMPENRDTNWMWDDFIAKNNDELVGAYGNFVHRVITFTQKNFGEIPKQRKLNDSDKKAIKKIEEASKEVSDSLEKCQFKKGLRAAMNLAQFGNQYFNQNEPWKLVKDNEERCKTVLYICLKIINALAVFTAPYLPFSSDKIWRILSHKESIHKTNWDAALDDLNVGASLERPQPLFKKLALEEFMTESDPFSKLDLRVAKVLEVKDIPNADTLYMLHLDVGKLGKRVIVAGMKPHYSKDEMKGRNIVIVTNLKPTNIRGVKSNGMLLAAEDGEEICSLLKPGDASPGSEVSIEGIPREPEKILEFEDFKKVNMAINENQEAAYGDKILMSEKGKIVSDKKIKKGAKIL